MRRIRGNHLAGLAVLAAAFSLAACGPAPSGSSSAPAQSSAAPAPSGSSAAAAPAPGGASAPAAQPSAPATQPSAKFVPMQTATGGEFVSPSGNISCDVTSTASMTGAFCETNSPYRSVTMSASGQYKICNGEQCLGNTGTGTPTLAYGTQTGVGPFRCESTTAGVTCTANGRGFQISTAGVSPISS